MKEIQCPNIFGKSEVGKISFFVAGGISNCPEWQKELISLLEDEPNLILVNPRRAGFDMDNTVLHEEQIKWEHDHLRRVDGHLFWFPSETLCPITLFELGVVSSGKKPLVVGTHPDYQRKRDIRWQMLLARPDANIVHSLEDLANQIRSWCNLAHTILP